MVEDGRCSEPNRSDHHKDPSIGPAFRSTTGTQILLDDSCLDQVSMLVLTSGSWNFDYYEIVKPGFHALTTLE